MLSRRALEAWPRTVVPEVGLVIARWTTAKAGAIASLWPASPRWVGRYVDEMLHAHLQSAEVKRITI